MIRVKETNQTILQVMNSMVLTHTGFRAEAKCLVNLVLPTFHHLTFRAVRESVLISQLNYDGLKASKIYKAPHSSSLFFGRSHLLMKPAHQT